LTQSHYGTSTIVPLNTGFENAITPLAEGQALITRLDDFSVIRHLAIDELPALNAGVLSEIGILQQLSPENRKRDVDEQRCAEHPSATHNYT
jgi:hypothetical protein